MMMERVWVVAPSITTFIDALILGRPLAHGLFGIFIKNKNDNNGLFWRRLVHGYAAHKCIYRSYIYTQKPFVS